MVTKKTPAKKSVSVKKSPVKDLKVGGKAASIKGGGGRFKASQPQTPSDPGCTPCS